MPEEPEPPRPGPSELAEVRRRFDEHPGLAAKAELAIVNEVLGSTDWIGGPGDDAALVPGQEPAAGGGVVVAGEAIWPAFAAADPFGAGIAAIVANVNDIAATGGRTLAIVDTVVGPAPAARRALEGMAFAAGLYGVPIVGGHLTVTDANPAISAFAVGRALRVLSATAVREGQALLVAACLEGSLRPDLPFFSSIRQRGVALAGDVAVLADLAERGAAVAAKDVSMAGLLGSLAMLLEPTRCGAGIDLAAIPRPEGVGIPDWTAAYLSYGFLLCAEPDRAEECARAFHARNLACARVGTVNRSGELTLRLGDDKAVVLDFAERNVTHLGTAPAHGAR